MTDPQTERRAASLHIVTDSFAHRTPQPGGLDARLHVVPNRLSIGRQVYREGVDISDDQAHQLLLHTDPLAVEIHAPTVSDYVAALRRLTDATGILIITPSRELSLSWKHARAAALQMSGMCPIAVVDSETLSCAQGLLVDYALAQAAIAADLDDLVQRVRGALERTYIALYIDSMAVLEHGRVLAPSHAVLGSLLGVRPLLTIENGQLTTMEKVRTRSQGIERLVEFIIEFADIEQAQVFTTRSQNSAGLKELIERLGLELPGVAIAVTTCGPSLAALVGSEIVGLVILERDNAEVKDGF